MAQDYEEIVRQWYNRLRPEFLRRLTTKYSGLSLYDAENLYQDTFIAVQENLILGRIKEDTSWSSYIAGGASSFVARVISLASEKGYMHIGHICFSGFIVKFIPVRIKASK